MLKHVWRVMLRMPLLLFLQLSSLTAEPPTPSLIARSLRSTHSLPGEVSLGPGERGMVIITPPLHTPSSSTQPQAKTIDLCNNPLTKIGKLENARRIIPEWDTYDSEIRKFEETLGLPKY